MGRLLAILLLLGTPALATTFYERPFPSMVKEAPIVVRGRVGMHYANWVMGSDGTKRIHTFHELAIDGVYKGNLTGRTVIMRELGGEKDGVGMEVSGTAQFDKGEEVVVFLGEKNSDGSYDVQGMMMGKFNIEKGDDGKEYLSGAGISSATHPALRGHEEVIRGEETEGQDGTLPTSRWSIEALRQLIHAQSLETSPSPVPAIPAKLPKVNSPAAPDPVPVRAAASPAPQLQPLNPEPSPFPWGYFLIGTGVFLGLLVLLFAATRSSSQR